ncbi:unnamed protein product [Paramecium sonneborni]|uniref:Uncharacterized protein n=1 Tax=Paramecium sonneborni TaxID=65129 RepID=A0A8S1R7Z1_9CILI|nr:unnamed protein product [Paramecium sonneborni]
MFTAIKIINHFILFKIIENILRLSIEKSYCMSVILNLQVTGVYFKQLLDLRFYKCININKVGLIKQLLDFILRYLLTQNIKDKLKIVKFQIKIGQNFIRF